MIGAAAGGDRDDVGHPEVRADPTEIDARRGAAREPAGDGADVGARAADVDHERVGETRERGRPWIELDGPAPIVSTGNAMARSTLIIVRRSAS